MESTVLGSNGGNNGVSGSGTGAQAAVGQTGSSASAGGSAEAGAGAAGGAGATSFREGLPPELRDNPSLKLFNNVNDLAKSYVEAQGVIGKKGLILPSENAKPEEWDKFFTQMGRPEKEKYSIKAPDGRQVNPKLLDAFKEAAYKHGLLPRQAQAILEEYTAKEAEVVGGYTGKVAEEQKAAIDGLRKEWGNAFDQKVQNAKRAVADVGGGDLAAYLEQTGLGNDVALIKAFSRVGELIKDDTLRGDAPGVNGKKTPAEIQAEINRIYSDTNHPYHKGDARAHSEMEELMRLLHSG